MEESDGADVKESDGADVDESVGASEVSGSDQREEKESKDRND